MNPGKPGTGMKAKPAQARSVNPFAGFRRPDLAPFLAWGGVMAKDFAKQTPTATAMLLAALGMAFFPVTLLWLNDGIWRPTDLVDSCRQIYPALLMISAFLLALSTGAEEEEAGTRALLDLLPASPYSHFASKLASVMALTALLTMVGGVLFGFLANNVSGTLWRGLANPPDAFRNSSSDGVLPVAPALALAVASMGLLSTLVFSNVIAAGVTGGLAATLWVMVFPSYATAVSGVRTPGGSYSLIIASVGASVACGAVYSAAWPWARERDSRRGLSRWAQGQTRAGEVSGGWLRSFAAGRVRFGPAAAARHAGFRGLAGIDPMQLPLAISCATIAAGIPLIAWFATRDLIGQPTLSVDRFLWPVVFSFIPAAALGPYAFTAGERDGVRYFLHALPVSRRDFFRARMAWLTRAAACLMGSMFVGVGLSMGLWMAALAGSPPPKYPDTGEIVLELLYCVIPAIAVLSALFNGALARLFQTRRLVAFACGFCVGLVNIISTGFGIMGMGQRTMPLNTFRTVSQLLGNYGPIPLQAVWCATVAVTLPVAAMAVALCRSRLLEQPERRRGTLGLLVAVAIAAWSVLLGFSPTQLWNILIP